MNTFLFRISSLRALTQHLSSSNVRFLYSPASLGVEDYVRYREKYSVTPEFREKFQEKMKDYCSGNDPTSMIFTEDLKQFVHITSGSDEELSIALQMMEKFHQQNSQLRFGTYHFGPVVMRMFYHFNKPEEALQAFKNPKLDGFFDQLSANVILFDLLFINGMYEKIIELYGELREKQLFFGKFPKNLMILVFASYYKLSTEEHFKQALALWKEMCDAGFFPLRKAACLVAALALKFNSPHIALEIISALSNQHFVVVRSIKVCSYCALGRIDDVFPILTSVLTFDAPNISKQTFPKEVIQIVGEAIEKENNKELSFEFSRIEKQLQSQNHISNNTVDDLLLTEVNIVKPVNRNQSVLRAAFNGAEDNTNQRNRPYNLFRRPGLSEMT